MTKRKGLYRIRKVWARITPLRAYALMTVRPVSEINVHHTVTTMPSAYFHNIRVERNGETKEIRREAHRLAIKMERDHMRLLEQIALDRGFDGISYSDIIFPSGRVYKGRGFTKLGAHTLGRNSISYGLSVVGNYDNDKVTDEIVNAYVYTINKGKKRHRVKRHGIVVQPHSATKATACPGAHMREVIPEIQRRVA